MTVDSDKLAYMPKLSGSRNRGPDHDPGNGDRKVMRGMSLQRHTGGVVPVTNLARSVRFARLTRP